MRNRGFLKLFSALMLTLIFFATLPVGTSALDIKGIFKKELPTFTEPEPAVKLYAGCESFPVAPSSKTLTSPTEKYESISALYDGDTGTVFSSANPTEVILDLGKAHLLAGVRITIPYTKKAADKFRCIGLEALVSRDKKAFSPAAVLKEVNLTDSESEAVELMFDGVGEYRYVKLIIPGGAEIAEANWLEYPEWTYTPAGGGRYNMKLCLHSFDVKRKISATVIAAEFNIEGILKNIKLFPYSFEPEANTDITIELPGVTRQSGDTYRIMVLDETGGSAISRPLNYSYNGASQKFSVANVFSDNMVIQADKPFTVWGTAPEGSVINIRIENLAGGIAEKAVVADSSCLWEADMGSFSPGGSYEMSISCGRNLAEFENLTFGDVWLCTGQSNMEYYMYCGKDTTQYMNKEYLPDEDIRFLNLLNLGLAGAGRDMASLPIKGEAWAASDKFSAGYSSAIGLYFAQRISDNYNIPVGIISTAVGDTEINRWLPPGNYGSFTGTDGGLYYNRIAPLSGLNIKGILMYQGEADQYRTHLSSSEYADAMAGLVDLYRDIWGADLPFYWAQLTRYKEDESLVREGQRLALERVKNPVNTGIISLIDLYGEYKGGTGSCREDIHPHQKEVAAERFFLYAQRDVYGNADTIATGPVYKSMEIIDDKIILTFDCNGSLRAMPKEQYADKLTDELIKKNKLDTASVYEFEIAGGDGVYKKAQAVLDGKKVILSSNDVKNPKNARYAWGAYPEMPNLTDNSCLPVLTFSTETN